LYKEAEYSTTAQGLLGLGTASRERERVHPGDRMEARRATPPSLPRVINSEKMNFVGVIEISEVKRYVHTILV